MDKDMNVVIIGTGNVATILGKLLVSKGHKVLEVVGRAKQKATSLANICGAKPILDFSAITDTADIYIIAVSDKAIEIVAKQLILKNKLVVHTAGSVSINIFNMPGNNYGVLWPLQTLRKEMETVPPIPFVVDAVNEATYVTLLNFTKTLTDTVFRANDAKRIKLHLTAVMVSNFTNHLYALANDYCHKEALDFKLLLPLIEETVNRIKTYPPHTVQTGPASRKDVTTIANHLGLLKPHPTLQKIYHLMSDSIMENKPL
ncbi:Rossmann-like and DUF2520 domain-containing protein [Parasediminibacterium sp. JCM 36343]|uniref:Rossmann-like and DUF2520 domain-containing protein n=1 Tax=Parasediminibacterium sp. JCM 36343 TaxID=3374279 RepID=UPI00397B52D0